MLTENTVQEVPEHVSFEDIKIYL